MKRQHFGLRNLFWIIIVVGLLTVPIKVAVASTQTTVTRYPFLSGVYAIGTMYSSQVPESSTGFCKVKSATVPSTNINVIGWTWWQCDRLRSNGTILQSVTYGGSIKTGASSHEAQMNWSGAFTGEGAGMRAHGVHDFNHTGSSPSPWQPYNANWFFQ